MQLPTSSDLTIFNHVLAVIFNLSAHSGACSIIGVNETCSKTTFNAQIINYRKVIELIEYCGLATSKDGKVSLTDKGKDFLNLNSRGLLEPTQEQKYFLGENSVFYGHYKHGAKRIFDGFIPDHDEMTYKYSHSDEYEIPLDYKTAFHCYKYLGILIKTEQGFSVSPTFVKHVREIRAEKKGISQEELELRLDANRKLAFKAEELVVEFEQKRLHDLGLIAEADRVRRISELEPGAGYDIRSFSGEGPMVTHDKLIEVKSSQKSNFEFYWTKNEIEVAEEIRDSYWIYFLSDFKSSSTLDEIAPLMIQNPYEQIINGAEFECEPRLYKVTKTSALKDNGFASETLDDN